MLEAGLETTVPVNTFRLSFLWSIRKVGDLGFVTSLEDLMVRTHNKQLKIYNLKV